MAVILNVATEDWHWDRVEPFLPMGMYPAAREIAEQTDGPLLNLKSVIDFGYNVGIHRIAETLRAYDVQTTFVTNGLVAERHPEILSALVDDGHEICAHAYSEGTPMSVMDRSDQAAEITRNVEVIEAATGEPPVGWINPGAYCNETTIELLAEHGFRYHADLKDDELPYFIDVGDETIVEVPSRLVGSHNDVFLFATAETRYSTEEAVSYLTSAVDAYLREAQRRPLMFRYPVHQYVSGRPDALAVYTEFIEHIQGLEDVWIASYRDIASWWRDRFEDGYE